MRFAKVLPLSSSSLITELLRFSSIDCNVGRDIVIAEPSWCSQYVYHRASPDGVECLQVRLSCLGCRTPLKPGTTDLCEHCRHKVSMSTHACLESDTGHANLDVLMVVCGRLCRDHQGRCLLPPHHF